MVDHLSEIHEVRASLSRPTEASAKILNKKEEDVYFHVGKALTNADLM